MQYYLDDKKLADDIAKHAFCIMFVNGQSDSSNSFE